MRDLWHCCIQLDRKMLIHTFALQLNHIAGNPPR
jgi:hypothetical protein